MQLVGRPYVEAIAVMTKYNPFFEKAGIGRLRSGIREDPFARQSTDRWKRPKAKTIITYRFSTAKRIDQTNEDDIEVDDGASTFLILRYIEHRKNTTKKAKTA